MKRRVLTPAESFIFKLNSHKSGFTFSEFAKVFNNSGFQEGSPIDSWIAHVKMDRIVRNSTKKCTVSNKIFDSYMFTPVEEDK